MKTLRLRIFKLEQNPDDACVLELNIHADRVHAVRLAISGSYDMRAGVPQVFFTSQDFIRFLEAVEEVKGDPVPVQLFSWEVWGEGDPEDCFWYGPKFSYQRALAIIAEKFHDE